jgi:hypothetical protein
VVIDDEHGCAHPVIVPEQANEDIVASTNNGCAISVQARIEDCSPPRFELGSPVLPSPKRVIAQMKGASMRQLVVLTSLVVLAAVAALTAPAGARPRGMNGQIAFARFDPALGDSVFYTINPDGSQEHQVLPFALECPNWSPDGTLIASCGNPDNGATTLINPDTGTYRLLPDPDPSLSLACYVWSPDGQRLACEFASPPADPSQSGIYTIRSSDGGGLTRMTANMGGHDIPGDYSPNGHRLVFARLDANGSPVGLFVIKVNGTELKQITPTGTNFSSFGNWSPQGNEIIFSRHVTDDVHSSLWMVRPDGTGLHEIQVQGVACGGANADPNAMACYDPHWSPDGTKIAFGIQSAAGKNIYTMKADGGDLTQVSHGGADDSPDWGTHPIAG